MKETLKNGLNVVVKPLTCCMVANLRLNCAVNIETGFEACQSLVLTVENCAMMYSLKLHDFMD